MTAAAGALPAYGALTALQRYGLDCAFCGAPLAPGAAVSLGWLRHRPAPGVRVVWAPRACRGCVEEGAP
ncbi:hypothetical protein [Streptomyces sp. CC228A]|uniref:hypothetical protein n=1 Tax=Streptomyces sp. CC228A TaxID=2898186 RepID=UPI001F3FF519|nr:hypothetical protein [Streptomyces sp. CC228A]